jgi:hypothetical protein
MRKIQFSPRKTFDVEQLLRGMLVLVFLAFCVPTLNAANLVWNGSTDNQWNNLANWELGNGTPATSLPGAGDNVTIDGRGAFPIPQLVNIVSFNSLTLNEAMSTNGGLDLNGNQISVTSLSVTSTKVDPNFTMNNGTIVSTGNVSISGGFFQDISSISGGNFPTLENATFSASVVLTKTGGGNMGNPGDNMTYQGDFTFSRDFTSGSGNVRFGRSAANTYQGNVTLINSGTGGNMTFGENFVASVSGNLTATTINGSNFEIGTAGGGATIGGAFGMLSFNGQVLLSSVTETSTGFVTFSGSNFRANNCIFRGPVSVQATNDILSLNNSQFLNASNSFIANSDNSGGGDIGSVSNSTFGPGTGGGSTTFSNGLSSSNPWNGGNTFNSDVSFIRTGATGANWRLDASMENFFGSDINPINVIIDNGTGTGEFSFAQQGATFYGNLTLTGTAKSAGGEVIMDGMAGAQTITGSNDGWTFPTLTVANAMGVSIDFSFNISSALSLSGVLELPTDKVAILGGSATLSGSASGYVSGGALQKLGNTATNSGTPFTFHVGADGFYAPFEYTTNNSGGSPEVTVQYSRPGPGPSSPPAPLELVSQTEQWLLTVDDTGLGNTVVTLPYGVQSGAIGDENDLRVAFSSDGGSSWTNLAGTASGGEIDGNAVAFSAGSTYVITLASINAVQTPLPVELIYFEAEVEEIAVQLRWATASEINNDYFQVERSSNGSDFQPVGAKIEGAGTTTEPLTYEFMDTAPLSGISYYRLKQVDFDGRYSHSDVKAVQVGKAAKGEMQLFPNPTRDLLQIRWEGDQPIDKLRLLDARGQLLSIDALINDKQAELNLNGLPAGMYFLELLSGKERKVEQLIISQ